MRAEGKRINDYYPTPTFGFREFWIEGRKCFMNGSEVRLRLCVWGWIIDKSERTLQAYQDAIGRAMDMGFTFGESDGGQEMHLQELFAEAADRKGFTFAANTHGVPAGIGVDLEPCLRFDPRRLES